jgi:hypothetical protein
LRLDVSKSPIQLAPIEGWMGIANKNHGTQHIINRYLRLLGPAGPAEAAAFLGTKPAVIKPVWPENLGEVGVDGRAASIPGDSLDALLNPPEPPRVRLLPPSDPYLQCRDRTTILPDAKLHPLVWTSIGKPGAILVGADIVGTWRPKSSGGVLSLSLSMFDGSSRPDSTEIGVEAERIASVRTLRLGSIKYSAD